nr:amidohydrolase family protein [Roseomonas aerilata]
MHQRRSPRLIYPPVPLGSDLTAYRAVQARLGLSRAVVVQPTAYGTDNSCTLDAVARLELGAARAVVAVTPETPASELRRLHTAGARGARAFMLGGGPVPWERLHALGAHVAPLGWHVQLQFDGGEMPEREALIRSLPCPVVIDHVGRFHDPVPPDRAGRPGLAAAAGGWPRLGEALLTLRCVAERAAWVLGCFCHRMCARCDGAGAFGLGL